MLIDQCYLDISHNPLSASSGLEPSLQFPVDKPDHYYIVIYIVSQVGWIRIVGKWEYMFHMDASVDVYSEHIYTIIE